MSFNRQVGAHLEIQNARVHVQKCNDTLKVAQHRKVLAEQRRLRTAVDWRNALTELKLAQRRLAMARVAYDEAKEKP